MELVLVFILISVVLLGGLAFALGLPPFGRSSGIADHMRAIVASQRSNSSGRAQRAERRANLAIMPDSTAKRTDAKLTLQKRLKFAQWPIPPILFRILEVSISLCVFSIAHAKLNMLMQLLSISTGFLFMRWLLNSAVDRRFKAFDADYPAYLLSLVGLLKTGMNTLNAVEGAAQGLEDGSLVKTETQLMIERLRFGVSEDKSIGAFGEDVYHPEIELFVQALLLSRRVGGTLSDTLDRLARQVRKRQYFRKSANAAIGMQRGSIMFIIMILCGLEVYLYFVYPQSVVDALKDPMGKQVWQFGITMITLGIFWIRQVTKIRV